MELTVSGVNFQTALWLFSSVTNSFVEGFDRFWFESGRHFGMVLVLHIGGRQAGRPVVLSF